MTSKIRIKMGPIEVEYEGEESFLKEELPELLEAVAKLHRDTGGDLANEEDGGDNGNDAVDKRPAKRPGKIQGTTATLAARLGCKAGVATDVILAAAARLTFVLDQESFSRKELLNLPSAGRLQDFTEFSQPGEGRGSVAVGVRRNTEQLDDLPLHGHQFRHHHLRLAVADLQHVTLHRLK